MDNKVIQSGGENTELEEWLRDSYGIYILWLHTRMSKWNHMASVWSQLVIKNRHYFLTLVREYITRAKPKAACDILSKVKHYDLYNCFKKLCRKKNKTIRRQIREAPDSGTKIRKDPDSGTTLPFLIILRWRGSSVTNILVQRTRY